MLENTLPKFFTDKTFGVVVPNAQNERMFCLLVTIISDSAVLVNAPSKFFTLKPYTFKPYTFGIKATTSSNFEPSGISFTRGSNYNV
ncbi:hypothetical protein B9Z55_008376 [Caenorhabditis nigoni]|uniref:Uncharacterized protein n=1 Tax=Caenorhabditis nigoni TaxID=1611254 RepID=A0A2G5UME9_9PELO|nr:hypothetical protein B9Z55_008376 [Caenorhabditis nigoni]